MSHEILLIAGLDEEHARERRWKALEHASTAVPGFLSRSILESATATLALVTTSPVGGTFASTMPGQDGLRITIATSRRGLEVSELDSALFGAEAGHVMVVLREDRSVFVATDGVGALPAYWGMQGETFFLATHLASLVSLGLGAELDECGLVEYLTMLHPMATRTLLQDASLLAAGAALHWDEGRVELKHAPLFMPSSDDLADEEVIQAFAETWPMIIADSLDGAERPSIGLSGGLDSRTIAEAAVALGHRPITYTYGTGSTYEAAVSARVADALALPHLSIPISDDRLLAHAASSLNLLDGAHSASEMYELWFYDLLQGFTDVVINGLDGGTLWGDDKAIGLTDPAAILNRQWKRYNPEIRRITPLLETHLQDNADEIIRRSLIESLEDWDLAARSDMVLFWRMANRQQRWGSMLTNALRRVGLRTEIPFLDSRFLALAARLTPRQRRNGALYIRVHRQLFPCTASIPRSDDGNAPSALNHVYWSGDSSPARQLFALTARHPISGLRRGLRLGGRVAFSELRSRTSLNAPADWGDARRTVFPADVWLRRRTTYAERLADLLEAGQSGFGIAGEAIAEVVACVRAGTPPVSALTLGKVAAAMTWTADYQRRQTARRHALSSPTVQ